MRAGSDELYELNGSMVRVRSRSRDHGRNLADERYMGRSRNHDHGRSPQSRFDIRSRGRTRAQQFDIRSRGNDDGQSAQSWLPPYVAARDAIAAHSASGRTALDDYYLHFTLPFGTPHWTPIVQSADSDLPTMLHAAWEETSNGSQTGDVETESQYGSDSAFLPDGSDSEISHAGTYTSPTTAPSTWSNSVEEDSDESERLPRLSRQWCKALHPGGPFRPYLLTEYAFDLEYFRALFPPDRCWRQHNVALQWHRSVGEELDAGARNPMCVWFSNIAPDPVQRMIMPYGAEFLFEDTKAPGVDWKWQYMVAHMNDDSKMWLLRGLDGESRSRRLVSCRLQKTEIRDAFRHDAALQQQREADELGYPVVVEQGPPHVEGCWKVWNFVVVCEDGVEIHVHPAWSENRISCFTRTKSMNLRFMDLVMMPVCDSAHLSKLKPPGSPPPSCELQLKAPLPPPQSVPLALPPPCRGTSSTAGATPRR